MTVGVNVRRPQTSLSIVAGGGYAPTLVRTLTVRFLNLLSILFLFTDLIRSLPVVLRCSPY